MADSSTWGEVVTKIGQADYGAARRVMQGHAVRLGLDVGHLPPFKPVAPRQPHDAKPVDRERLANAIRESGSWGAVLHRMGYRKSGSVQGRLRDRAAELGLDTSHFRGQAWGSTPVNPVEVPFTRQPDPKHLRKAATALATAWFMERGYLVCVPTEPAPYDLVVESDEGFIRVQVKSTSKRARTGATQSISAVRRIARTQRVRPTVRGPAVHTLSMKSTSSSSSPPRATGTSYRWQ